MFANTGGVRSTSMDMYLPYQLCVGLALPGLLIFTPDVEVTRLWVIARLYFDIYGWELEMEEKGFPDCTA